MGHLINEFELAHEEFIRRFQQEAEVPNLRNETLSKTVWCDPDELNYSAPSGARNHAVAEVDLFQKTIHHYNGALPVVIDDDGNIFAGQGRVEASKLLGIERIPALVLSTLTRDDVQHYLETIGEFGSYVGWSQAMLSIDLQALRLIVLKQAG